MALKLGKLFFFYFFFFYKKQDFFKTWKAISFFAVLSKKLGFTLFLIIGQRVLIWLKQEILMGAHHFGWMDIKSLLFPQVLQTKKLWSFWILHKKILNGYKVHFIICKIRNPYFNQNHHLFQGQVCLLNMGLLTIIMKDIKWCLMVTPFSTSTLLTTLFFN